MLSTSNLNVHFDCFSAYFYQKTVSVVKVVVIDSKFRLELTSLFGVLRQFQVQY